MKWLRAWFSRKQHDPPDVEDPLIEVREHTMQIKVRGEEAAATLQRRLDRNHWAETWAALLVKGTRRP